MYHNKISIKINNMTHWFNETLSYTVLVLRYPYSYCKYSQSVIIEALHYRGTQMTTLAKWAHFNHWQQLHLKHITQAHTNMHTARSATVRYTQHHLTTAHSPQAVTQTRARTSMHTHWRTHTRTHTYRRTNTSILLVL